MSTSRISDGDVDGAAHVAASTLLAVVILYPSVQTPHDAIVRAHRLLDEIVAELVESLGDDLGD